MKKKSISAIAAASMLACVATAVPASAAEVSTLDIAIKADVTKAHVGDVIDCSFTIKADGPLYGLEAVLQLPEGVEYVSKSGKIVDPGVKGMDIGWDDADISESNVVKITGFASDVDGKYPSGKEIVYATFQVKVTGAVDGPITVADGAFGLDENLDYLANDPTVTGLTLGSYAIKEVEETESTCTKHGVKAHYACECGKELYSDAEGKNKITAADVEKPLLDHEPTEEGAKLKSDATCVSPAVYAKVCAVCGTELDETFEKGEVNPDNHTHIVTGVGYVAATTEEEGYTGDTVCEDCETVIEEGEVIDKLPSGGDDNQGGNDNTRPPRPSTSGSSSSSTSRPSTPTDSSNVANRDLTFNSNNGVVAEAKEGVLLNNTDLIANVESSTDTSVLYDIKFLRGGKEVEPNGTVTIKIPVPAAMAGKTIYVYRVEEDGSYTNMNAKVEGDYVVFTTDHFSKYLVTTENKGGASVDDGNSNKPGNTSGNPATGISLAIAPVLLAAGAVVTIYKRKK